MLLARDIADESHAHDASRVCTHQPPQAQTKKSESTIKEAIVDSSDEEQDNKPLSRRNVNASTHVQKKVCFALYACQWATRIIRLGHAH